MEISEAEKCFKIGFFLSIILKLYITTKLGLDVLGCKESNLPVSPNSLLLFNRIYLGETLAYFKFHVFFKMSKFLVGKKVILRMGDNIKAQFPLIRLVSLNVMFLALHLNLCILE